MNDNSNDTALLIQYLDGELSREELELAREKINSNIELREELEKLLLARAAVKVYGLKQKVGGIHSEMMQELKKSRASSKGKVFTLLKSAMYVAASIILLVGVMGFYQYLQLSPDNLYQDNYHVYTPNQSRSTQNESSIKNALKANQPDLAIKLFKNISEPSVTDYFHVANAYLQKGDAPIAIESFLQVHQKNAANKTHFFDDDTDYYLGMAYLKNNQLNQAIQLFEKIHSDSNHLYHDKVNKWFMWKLQWLKKKQ